MRKEKLQSIRHGEIMLVPVDKLPKGTVQQHKNYIIGHSETGHHHVLESEQDFDVLELVGKEQDKRELYIRLFEPAKLVHKKTTDKHKTLTIPKGIYKRYHDTEYDPFEGLIQDVRD